MLHLPTVERDLGNYIDAGFPIIYIRTFEEIKAEKYIASIAGQREVHEWNGADGYVNFRTKAARNMPNPTLEATLSFLKKGKNLDRQMLVIKDADEYLKTDSPLRSDKVILI